MVFPTVSYSTKINSKFSSRVSSNKKARLNHPKVGPRHAPNIYDRIAAYDRAFQKCIQMDSKLSSWKRRMDEKGLPQPLIQGYQRSSSSWQHSLSSLSSESSSTYSHDFYSAKTRKSNDVQPTRSITVSSSSSSSSSSMPSPVPKPSVSRRIINRLSLSRTNNISRNSNHTGVVPISTQSSYRRPSITSNKDCQQYQSPHYHYPSVMSSNIISPSPSPSLPRTTRLYPHMSMDQQDQERMKTMYHHIPTSMATSRKPSVVINPPCGIEEYLLQKRYSTVHQQQQQQRQHHHHHHHHHHFHRHKLVSK
ncbi:uncharacterized protein BX664DRAFT_357516 [Halteromyces radiatus]|uniref:uncharacterized protein n=1 Tax=Halteromyces radiatus TaxID=101107 RepID=UPI002220222D|nr:uncharacterized protein BX664DRAFT_357516 [Halteromyces radiatus]KAI8093038.1 hypothetical protein BX664DRAFT_357516 [Halteromyces radiatus]